MPEQIDIAVVGAGAAGLFAAIWAGRTLRAAGSDASVVAFDGARSLGAKILIAAPLRRFHEKFTQTRHRPIVFVPDAAEDRPRFIDLAFAAQLLEFAIAAR